MTMSNELIALILGFGFGIIAGAVGILFLIAPPKKQNKTFNKRRK